MTIQQPRFGATMARMLDEHGMLGVLFVVAMALSLATLRPNETSGRDAGISLGESLAN